MSASQLKQYNGCQARWAYVRIEGRKEPQGIAAAAGTAMHLEMERWAKFGELPTSKQACGLLKYAPAPGVGYAEVPISFRLSSGPFMGYIDHAVDWDGKSYRQLGETGWTVLIDWKSTGTFDWAKTAEELLEDEAANLYAYEAFLGGAERVSGRWLFVIPTGTVKDVWFDFDRQHVEEVVERLNQTAHEAQRLYKIRAKPETLEKNRDYCYSFRKECPFKTDCNPPPKVSRGPFKASKTMTKFEEHLDTVAPDTQASAPKKTPPPLPAKKAPPPLPGKRAVPGLDPASIGVPESGFINSPGGPTIAAATPEEAAIIQNIQLPVPEVVVTDDLDAMELHQLKALATAIGADFLPRARSASVISAIRAKRAEAPVVVVSADDQSWFDEKAELAARAVAARVEADVAMAEETPVTASPVSETVISPEVQGPFVVSPDSAFRPGFKLFINCRPERGDVEPTHLAVYLQSLMAGFTEATGCADYRAVDFGKGVGVMAEGIIDELQNGRHPAAIIIDTRTQEGFAFCGVFERFAGSVYRGI